MDPVSSPEAEGAYRARTALLVDDDDELARILARALERAGFVVHRARAGTDALALLANVGRLDAAIVDLVLPGAGGIEVARRIRAAFPACRIVAVTGLSDPTVERAFREAGADDFLPKPVELKQLLDAVSR
jgi:DNA-binding response OmpR family regulator